LYQIFSVWFSSFGSQVLNYALNHFQVMAMGHRENVNLQQVKTALEMESHEEKLHNMIRQVHFTCFAPIGTA
jgi:hypothetical protein